LNEFHNLLEGIYTILEDKFWISPVNSIRKAENKIFQMIIAEKIGFEIPESLITTLKSEAISFIRSQKDDCIIKAIKTGFIENKKYPKIIFTNNISKNILSSLDRIKYCPTYFQKRVEKSYDLRVTVVGKVVFPAKIDSQSFEETKTDWRKGENAFLNFEALNLHETIKTKCIDLTKALNLQFSAIDLVVDINNKIEFLEINPNGQWAWIEKRLDYNISGELSNLLIKSGSNNEAIQYS